MTQEISEKTVIVSRDEHLTETVDGDLIILNTVSGTYYKLSGIGNEIWDQLQQPTTINQLSQTIGERYEIDPEQCHADVRAFIHQLFEANLIMRSQDDNL